MTDLLVCAPAYFNIDYEINPWMNVDIDVDGDIAVAQWGRMCSLLTKAGANLKYIEPEYGYPDMVFTANAGLVHGKTVVLSNFRHKERVHEKWFFKDWFLKNGYRVIEIPDEICFEGEGDALFLNDVLFMGYGFRTDIEAHSIVANALGVDYVSCELIDPKFYHLDTCFFPMDDRIVYHRDAFSDASQMWMIDKFVEIGTHSGLLSIINVHEDQANDFLCNSIEIGDTVITPSDQFSLVLSGKQANTCDMSEFMKSGGAIKCLTLRL